MIDHVRASIRAPLRGLNDLAGPLVFLTALALTIVAYSPGIGGSLHFDDPPSLAALGQVADASSALRFVIEGIAGPLGRPLALASFVPQAYAWPSAPEAFLYVNICIHILNGVLVVWMLYLLGIARGAAPSRAAWVAAMSGALWMLMPILASSSLLIVQRMTTLSATFSLLGLIAYLSSRRLCGDRPLIGISLMTLALVFGAGFSMLTKENGALLPLFVLIIEATLLSRPLRPELRRLWNAWFAVVLVAPAAVLVAYLASQVDYNESTVLMRGFTSADRLLTQAHVLWEYLYHAFLPATSNLGPFHDDYPAYRDWLSASSLLAVGGWLAVVVCALRFGRRAPLFSFAVGWYLVGHSLESTAIPLELYFEHRNYLPLIGPVFSLVSAAAAAKLSEPLVRTSLVAYGVLLAAVLFSTTSLWGRPALAAEIWFKQHPESSRAVQYVAQQYHRAGDLHGVRRVLSRYAEEHPASSATALQALVLSCVLEPTADHREQLRAIKSNLPRARFEYATFDALQKLYHVASTGQCEHFDREAIYELVASIAAHPVFRHVRIMRHNLHILMAEEGIARRDLDLTMRHIETALAAQYKASSLALAVNILTSAGLHSTAQEFLDEARAREPPHPLRAALWSRQIAALDTAVRESMDHD